jgi:hypothetical protein
MSRSLLPSCSISVAAIALSAIVGVLFTPACALAQSSPHLTRETVSPHDYFFHRVEYDARSQCARSQSDCYEQCPRRRLGNIEALDKKCIQKCKHAYGC